MKSFYEVKVLSQSNLKPKFPFISVFLLTLILITFWSAYYYNFMNGYLYVGFIMLEAIFVMILVIFFTKKPHFRKTYSVVLMILLIALVFEYRLIYQESYSHLVYGSKEPEEIVKDSGIYLLGVNTSTIYVADGLDDSTIKDSYENGSGETMLHLYPYENKDRYNLKNEELLSFVGLKKSDWSEMEKNVLAFLGELPNEIKPFLNEEDNYGNSAGLALVLSSLIGKGELNNQKQIAVTGAIGPTGNVLAIGAMKEKMLISEQYGFSYIMIPEENFIKAAEVKKEQNLNIEIIAVSHIDEATNIISEMNN